MFPLAVTPIVVLVAMLAGFAVPAAGASMQPLLVPLLMVLMFFGCLPIKPKSITGELKDWRRHLAVLAIVHFCSPLLLLLARPWLSPEIFVGFVLAAAVSSGVGVVFLSRLFRGVPAEALIITTVSNVASPLLVPIVVWGIAGSVVTIPLGAMAVTMAKLIFIPLAAALIVQHTRWYQPLKQWSSAVSIGVLALTIFGMVAAIQPLIVADIWQSISVGAVVAVLVAINYGLGWLLRGSRAERVTYALAASYKNFTLAMVVALAVFGPAAALPAVLYAVVNNVQLIPLAWRGRSFV